MRSTDAAVVIAAGAPGVELLPEAVRRETREASKWRSISTPCRRRASAASSRRTKRSSTTAQICYGAIGVGGTKMKLHKAAIRRLFETNDAGARCRGDLRAWETDLTTKAQRTRRSHYILNSFVITLCSSWCFLLRIRRCVQAQTTTSSSAHHRQAA